MAKLKMYCINRNITKPLEVITIESKNIYNIYDALSGRYDYTQLLIKKLRGVDRLPFTVPYPFAHLLSANIVFDDDGYGGFEKEENKIKLEIHTFAGSDYLEELVFKKCKMKIEYVDIKKVDLPKIYLRYLGR